MSSNTKDSPSLSSIPPQPPRQVRWKIIFSIAVVAICFIVAAYLINYWKEDNKEIIKSYNSANKLFDDCSSNECLSSFRKNEISKGLEEAKTYIDKKEWQDAHEIIEPISSDLSSNLETCKKLKRLMQSAKLVIEIFPWKQNLYNNFCTTHASAMKLLKRGNTKEANQKSIGLNNILQSLKSCDPEILRQKLESKISNFRDDCENQANKIINYAVFECRKGNINKVAKYKNNLDEMKDRCEELKCNDSLVTMNLQIKSSLSSDCRIELKNILNQARAACNSNNNNQFNELKYKFHNYLNSETCRQKPCKAEKQTVQKASQEFDHFIQQHKNSGIAYNTCDNFDKAEQNMDRAKSQLRKGNCSQADRYAKAALDLLRNKIQTCLPLYGRIREVEKCRKKPSGKNNDNLVKKLNQIKTFIDKCQCPDAERVLSEAEKLIKDIIPGVRYKECDEAMHSGRSDAWEICLDVTPKDPEYAKAMMDALVSANNDPLSFSLKNRKKLVNAFEICRETHTCDGTPDESNALVLTAIICAHGWDPEHLAPDTVIHYYKELSEMGVAAYRQPNWWRVLLIVARCKYDQWERNKNIANSSEAIDAAYDIKEWIEKNRDRESAKKYILEVGEYIRDIKKWRR